MTKPNEPPREFWIQETAYNPSVFYSRKEFESHEKEMHELEERPFCEAIHVVEYSALQAAQDKIQQLELTNAKLTLHVNDIEKANDNCQTKIAELEKQNKIMRDALNTCWPGEYGLAVIEFNRQTLKQAEEV